MPGRAPSFWWGAALLVLSTLVPAGCGRGEPSGLPQGKGGGGVLRVVLPSEPRTLDPNSTTDEIALLYDSDADRQRALEAGFQMHLAKPVEPRELAVAAVAGRAVHRG